MSRHILFTVLWVVVAVGFIAISAAAESDFLYGKILMDDGEELTGRIRWDKNEGSWDDILDASNSRREISKSRSSSRKVSIFGIEVYTDGGSWSSSSQTCIRFGYIDKIIPRSRSKATVILKDGKKLKLSGGADIGSSIRELLVDDINEGLIEIDWDDIDEIDFLPDDSTYEPSREFAGHRLYGEVETDAGIMFEGFIQWDVDEIWSTDILDGDQRNRSRKIPFRRIAKIEKLSSRASKVILTNDTEMRLSGSNDVNDENRGIVIMVPDWGRVKVDWEEFESLTFKKAPVEDIIPYDDYEQPWRLRGTVFTDSGDEYEGNITWDNDEMYSWEFLDGNYRDMEFDIEFGKIKEISRRTSRSAEVTLFSGDKFRLRGSNDVDDSNNGIIIETDDDGEIEVDWDEFERLVLVKGN